MGKWVHRQQSFDLDAETFTCTTCGTVPLWVSHGKPKCSNSPGSPKQLGVGSGNGSTRVRAIKPSVKGNWPKCKNCNRPTTAESGYCGVTSECKKLNYACVRYEAFAAYGGAVCVCCEETRLERLSVDHVFGDGHVDRRDARTVKGGGKGVSYSQLRARGFPDRDRYQVLCHNCNMEKGVKESCPCRQPSILVKLRSQGSCA